MVTSFSKSFQVSVSPLFIINPHIINLFIVRDIPTLSIEKKDLYTSLSKAKNSCTKIKSIQSQSECCFATW